MAYLEYENSCGRALQEEAEEADPDGQPPVDPVEKESERLNCDGKGFDKNIRRLVYSKIQTAFADRGDRNLKEEDPRKGDRFVLFGSGHGALFHLEQLAYYQAKYRLDSKERVKGSDAFRYVAFFDDEDDKPQGAGEQLLENDVIRRERYVDIVLEDDSGRETWVELKSYAAKSKANRTELDIGKIGNWRLGTSDRKPKKGYFPSLHRQFVIDRTAKHLGGAWLAMNQSERKLIDVIVEVKDFQWKFQKFSVDNRRTKRKQYSPDLGSERSKGTIRERLARLPKYNNDQNELVEVSMGRREITGMSHHVFDSGIAATLKEVLPGLGFEMIEDAVEDVIIEGVE
ncbi:hypothetical protein [Marinobacter algicola]|nr:hypothetical protein [Marinobacter algicola]